MDLTVRFLVVETGAVVNKHFDSYFQCRNFVNKMKRSRQCKLLSYPTFEERG